MEIKVLIGIKNSLWGDDGIGVYIAKNFQSRERLSLDCGTVPENFTSVVRKEKPQHLVIVDAAELSLKPGGFRIIPKEKISSANIGTYSLQLSQLISYLENYVGRIIFIGVQPKIISDSDELSYELKKSAERIIKILKEKKFDELIEI